MKLDIRTQVPVTQITFATKRELWLDATNLTKHSQGGIIIQCEDRDALLVKDRESVDNLIKALEKAKELNWV